MLGWATGHGVFKFVGGAFIASLRTNKSSVVVYLAPFLRLWVVCGAAHVIGLAVKLSAASAAFGGFFTHALFLSLIPNVVVR
jgi:hypothetical protein